MVLGIRKLHNGGKLNMAKKLTVINRNSDKDNRMSKTQRTIFLFNAWYRQCKTSFEEAGLTNTKDIPNCSQEDLMKIVFANIKFMCNVDNVKMEYERLNPGYWEPLKTNEVWYPLMELIFTIAGQLKLKNFVTIFPITKDYDGEKWKYKDYFYIMDVLSKMDWEKPIGTSEDVYNLLWNYQNDDLRHVYVMYMTTMSEIYRSKTGKGIIEEWCEDVGIDTYAVDQTAGIIKNNQTGEVNNISRCPSYLRIIK